MLPVASTFARACISTHVAVRCRWSRHWRRSMAFGHVTRTLLKSPWYAATSIVTIALTIALGSTVFAVVDGVLFKPLPYRSADRLFDLQGSAAPGQGGTASISALDA